MRNLAHTICLILAILACSAVTPLQSKAAWIDDWIQQKTTTNADYFEGQKRGYGTLGGFSARWSPTQDHPVSITPPKFKAGCGGIDVFMGGFSFLNADYLVQKLQNMINAAPAVAFDMALNTLCSQCSKTIKSMEAISSRLNQLQFDDCKATKAGVSFLLNDAFSANAAKAAKNDVNVMDFLNSTGAADMWQEVKRQAASAPDKSPGGVMGSFGASPTNMVSACPAVVTAAFFTTGSLLDHLASLRSYSLDYVDLIRGYVGDVNIKTTTHHDFQYERVLACPQNTPEKIDGLLQGDVYQRADPSSVCTRVTSITVDGTTYPSVRQWIFSTLSDICTAMTSRAGLTSAESDFLKEIPMPLYNGIMTDVQAQGSGAGCASVADMYADSVAAAYGYNMMTDFYDMIEKSIDMARLAATNQQGSTNAADNNHCNIGLASKGLLLLEDMKETMPGYIEAARKQYGIKLSGLVSFKEYDAKVKDLNDLVRSSLTRYFNGSMARRVSK
jgi:conjugative transfer pilus assembly protein TraH